MLSDQATEFYTKSTKHRLKSTTLQDEEDHRISMTELFLFNLFAGLPLVLFTTHIATPLEEEQQNRAEAGQRLNGCVVISCHPRHSFRCQTDADFDQGETP